jgi:hypothetical protein
MRAPAHGLHLHHAADSAGGEHLDSRCPFRCGLVFRTIHGEQPNLQVDLVDGRVDPPTDKHWNSPRLDLLCALFTTTAGDETRAREPLHTTLGVQKVEYLKMHLRDPDLNISRVAGEHGISERYAYLILSRPASPWPTGCAPNGSQAPPATSPTAHTPRHHRHVREHPGAFPDQANFTRAFRRVYAVSPREYRRQGRESLPTTKQRAPRI